MNRIRPILIAPVLAAALFVSSPAAAQDDVELFQQITLKQIMGTGWPAFERTFAALMSDARNDDAFREMSVIVGEAGALNKVAPYLETLVRQRGEDVALRTILGRVYKDLLRDPTRARTHFEAALARAPKDFFVHYQLASLFAREGDKGFAEAVKHFGVAAAEVPSRRYAELRTRILKEYGALLYSRREADAAYVQKAFDVWDAMTGGIREYDLVTYEELAGEYRARALWHKVQETYERYFEKNDAPDSVTRCRLKTRIGEARENRKHTAEAIDAYNEAIALLEANTWQRRKLETRVHQCHEQLSQLAAHETTLRKAVDDAPNAVAPRQSLARMLVRVGRLDEAATVLEDARKLAPRHVPVLNALEDVYRRSGRDDDLATILRARIALSDEDFDAYVDLAEVHVRRKDTAAAERVLSELETSTGTFPEKSVLLARACSRYGLHKRAFVLYHKLIDAGAASPEVRVAFCDFCLTHETFAAEADAEAVKLCDEKSLDAEGYVTLANVFRRHGKTDTALAVLLRGIAACRADDRHATFTLNAALSDLEHSLGEGHHAQAIGATLKALLAAPSLHFKRQLNDRLVTLLLNYGHRHKLLYTAVEAAAHPEMLGGSRGEGIAPWVDFLNVQANAREDADLWMLLGQIHETVEVDAELPPKPVTRDAQPRKVKTHIAQARLCYQKVVDMAFQNLDAHLALARVLADPAVDEYELAVNELEVLSLLNPVTRWTSIQAIGDLYADAGETALARARWLEVAEQSASEPNLLAQIAMRMFRAGELPRALALAEEARAISPHVFSYRVAYASLLSRAATAEQGTALRTKVVAEMTEALRLAEASPELSDFVPRVTRGLFDGHTSLARRYFAAAAFKRAQGAFAAAAKLLSADDPRVVDAQVQVARCDEALGDRATAMGRYEALLKNRPDVSCWVSAGVTVSSRSFLSLKRSGSPLDGAGTTTPGVEPVQARALPSVHLHAGVRGVLADGNRLFIEGTHRRFVVDATSGRLVDTQTRKTPLTPGPLTLLAAGKGRTIIVHADDVRAIRSDSGEVIWSKTAHDLAAEGRLQRVKMVGRLVAAMGTKGLCVLRADDGTVLWRRAGAWMTFDLDGKTLALLGPVTPTGRELRTLEPATGKVIARASVSASTLWHPPALAGDVVLLTDSFNGKVSGFDVRTGRERFTFALDVQPIRPLTLLGDVALVHTLRDGTLWVKALDLKLLRIRFDVPVGVDERTVDGLPVPPLVWGKRVLYMEGKTATVFILDTRNGHCRALAPTGSIPRRQWTLVDHVLCLIGAEGDVHFRRLSVGK